MPNKSESNRIVTTNVKYSGILHKIFDKFYAPLLFKNVVRFIVVIVFVGWNCFAFSMIHRIPVELNQKLSMPKVVLHFVFIGFNGYILSRIRTC